MREHTDKNPPIVLIIMDTMRADRVGRSASGCQITPVVDSLSSDSLVFTNASSPSSWTLPAHASLFTGLYPYQHGVHWTSRRDPDREEAGGYCAQLPSAVDTLAEVLSVRGYSTFGISANYWLTPEMGFAQGFDEYHVAAKVVDTAPFTNRAKPYVLGDTVVDRALALLDHHVVDSFFLFINLMDPHSPYYPETGFECASLTADARSMRDHPLADGNVFASGLRRQVNLERRKPPAAVRKRIEALYDDEVAYTDHLLGRIVDDLAARDLLNEAIIIVASDHGESFFVHDLVMHGLGVYEETVHVPLLIRAPGRVPSGRVAERVELIDVMPTLLELVGASDTDVAQSRSWFGVDLLDESARYLGRAALSENYQNPWDEGLVRRELRRTSRAVVVDNWKLVEWAGDPVAVELFDLNSDPCEVNNVVGTGNFSDRVDDLRAFAAILTSGATYAVNAEGDMTQDQIDALRALGYLAEEER